MMRKWLLFVLLSTSIAISNATFPGPTESGLATVFLTVDTDSNNNCVWQGTDPITNKNIFPFGNFAAVDSQFFRDAESCGECYELSCVSKFDTWAGCDCINDAKVTVMVMDYGHDLHMDPLPPTFDLPQSVADNILSGGNDGCQDGSRYNIQYRQVCCDHLQNIAVFNYQGINDRWLSFVVANVRRYGTITDLWMRENGRTQYYACNRDTNGMNNNWVCDPWTDDAAAYNQGYLDDNNQVPPATNDPPYQLPIDIKIRDSNGEELESLALITTFTAGDEFDFGANFEPDCQARATTLPPSSNPVTSTKTPDTTADIDTTAYTTTGTRKTKVPTQAPIRKPVTLLPTEVPTPEPSPNPAIPSTRTPTKIRTKTPTKQPTEMRTKTPTKPRTETPTKRPTKTWWTKRPTKPPTKKWWTGSDTDSDTDSGSSDSDDKKKKKKGKKKNSAAKTEEEQEVSIGSTNEQTSGKLFIIWASIICIIGLVVIILTIIGLKYYYNKIKKGEMISNDSDGEYESDAAVQLTEFEGEHTQGTVEENVTLKS